MPKIKTIQTNFSAGVLSPQALGRVDIARYPNAAKVMVNVISRTLGGAKKRYGTQKVEETKHQDKRARLIPYVLNRDTAYMLEMGHNYMRVFKTDGTRVGAPYEITTPYTEAFVADIDYCQAEDTMYVFHSSVPINRLRTFGDAKWDCSAAPFTTTPFAEQGDYPAIALTLSLNTVGTGRTMTAAGAVFLASDVGRAILWNSGIAIITGFTSTTVVTVEVRVIFDSVSIPSGAWNLDSSPQTTLTPSAATPVGASITLTLSADGWRAGDVGKFVLLNSGLAKITAFSSALAVTATIIEELSSAVAVPALAWTLESTVWTAGNGYPRTGALHEQRLIAAGTTKNPQTVWGSRSGEELDFTLGVNDDDAFSFRIAGNNANQPSPISFVVSSAALLLLTYGGEYSMRGGVEKPITPTNVQVKPQGPHGSSKVKPVQVGKETIFVQRALRKLRAMGYKYDEDGYKSPDITTLGEHITETGIVGIAFQQEPDPVLWAHLTNGRLISVTIDRDLDILACNTHETDGSVESVAVMPAGELEQVWLIVRRKLGDGTFKRYVERMRPDWYPIYGTASPDPNIYPPGDEPFSWGFTLDCATTADNASGTAVWTGLGHLEGITVRCLADGVDMPPMVVTSGQITLPRTAKRILVGRMFKPRVELLAPQLGGDGTTIQADAMSTSEFVVRMHNTIGCTVNGDQALPGRINGPAQLDKAPELFTGDKFVSQLGWQKGKSDIVISQDDPFPFHLLATIRSLTVNAG